MMMKKAILGSLIQICQEVNVDFAAIAVSLHAERNYFWRYMVGNRSERSKSMSFRIGRGIGGQTFRIGKVFFWESKKTTSNRPRLDCPLIQVEMLISAVGIPMKMNKNQIGVLVVGKRSGDRIANKEIELVELNANQLCSQFCKQICGA